MTCKCPSHLSAPACPTVSRRASPSKYHQIGHMPVDHRVCYLQSKSSVPRNLTPGSSATVRACPDNLLSPRGRAEAQLPFPIHQPRPASLTRPRMRQLLLTRVFRLYRVVI